ncbi:hypothetical protein SAY87_010107 [Trapa incisa]|uniref:Uncharacterized protein n=1 Tax=Trapa incisa TaxID=236973 RepID=A0AAN7GDQ2_9MYRT|nr:hypothetical protein SAY87_010107 [Trapa incisa]
MIYTLIRQLIQIISCRGYRIQGSCMDAHVSHFGPAMSDASEEGELLEVKKGPWTVEEDARLMNYVSVNGEGRWNSVARFAGLKRTGKSCRLRWLNYLRPDLRRGNITLQEQLLILELYSRWGNRWSKIAQHLPGRTDNEIKNYWRTRVQKQARQMKCDVNSKRFRDTMHNVWMPRLRERIESLSAQPGDATDPVSKPSGNPAVYRPVQSGSSVFYSSFSSENSMASSDSYADNSLASDGSCITEGPNYQWPENWLDLPGGQEYESSYWADEMDRMVENLWNDESIWALQKQLFDD